MGMRKLPKGERRKNVRPSLIKHMKFLKTPYTIDREDEMVRQLPFQTPRLSDKPVCDFCGDPTPVTMYGANRMTTGDSVSCWRWCACIGCERLIDHNQWDEFAERVATALRKLMPHSVPAEVTTQAVWSALGVFFRDATRVG